MYKVAGPLLFIIALSGCSTNSANMAVGNSLSYLSIDDQRNASQTITMCESKEGLVQVGDVEASRCHRNTSQVEPTEETLLMDLKVSAYARGADCISDVRIKQVSGLGQNCWYILDGKAAAYRVQKNR